MGKEGSMSRTLTRRQLLALGFGLAAVAPVVAACSSTPAASPTAAPGVSPPAKPTQASQGAPATQAPASGAKVTLRLMRFAGVGWEQDVKFVDEFMKKNPNIVVKGEDTLYNDMFKKCLALAATGTLADLQAGHNKWMPYLGYKGIQLELDPLVKEHPEINFNDFFPSVIKDARSIGVKGKLYWLPTIVHPGGNIIVVFNNDLLSKAGVEPPPITNLDWTIDDLEKLVRQAARPKEGILGIDVTYNSPLYAQQVTRTWSSDPKRSSDDSWLLSRDGKKEQLDAAGVKAAFEWYWNLIKDGLVPTAQMASPGANLTYFTAGKQIAHADIVGYPQLIHDQVKFTYSAVLWPKGPHGMRGTCLSYNTYAIYAKTKYPEESFKLLDQLTNTEIGFWAGYQGHANPYARHSVWSNPELWKRYPITQYAGQLLDQGVDRFPQPYNLRFPEWLDAWNQHTSKFLNGQENFDQMYQHTQPACQAILDQPRP